MNPLETRSGFLSALEYSWRTALALLVIFWVLSLLLLWPSVQSISHIWFNSETYAHGMIILPLALFLVWTRREALARVRPQPTAWGLVVLAAAGVAWMLARSVDVELVQHFALVAMLPGLVITLLGWQVARLLIFPLAYLFFAVPFGDFIVPVLQDFTAWFTVLLLKLTGLPVYKEGYYISIPAGDFVVAEVCSGIRYLIASIALGLIYAYISYRSLWRRLALVALAILLPILANGIRAYGIIMIAHWTNMKHAVGVDHLIYGWVFFGFVMLLLFWLGSLWREKTPVEAFGTRPLPVARQFSPRYMVSLLLALGIVLAAPRAGELWLQQQAQQVVVTQAPALPAAIPGWSGPQQAVMPWQPQYFDADAELAGVYTRPGAMLELHLLQYLNHGEGSEIVSWRNRIYDGKRWRRSDQSTRQVRLSQNVNLSVRETILRGPGGTWRVVWHWYQMGNNETIRGVEVKLREVLAVLAGDGRGAFVVAVSMEDGGSLEQMRGEMARFVQALPRPLGYRLDE